MIEDIFIAKSRLLSKYKLISNENQKVSKKHVNLLIAFLILFAIQGYVSPCPQNLKAIKDECCDRNGNVYAFGTICISGSEKCCNLGCP